MALAVTAAGFVFWRAWVCDDAFITFRHVANCQAGHGPVFNIGERVQGFTHPLWFLVLLAGAAVFDVYAFAVCAGVILTAATVLLLARQFRRRPHGGMALAAVVLALLSSRTFVEYQTSGLETALLNMLLVLLYGIALGRGEDGALPVGRTALVCSLLLLTRLDHVFLCAPLLAWTAWRSLLEGRRGAALAALAAGLLPLLLWHGFATVYYGTPLPNTAYAKVALPWQVAAAAGIRYARDFAMHEPVHAALVALVLPAGLCSCVSRLRGKTGGTARSSDDRTIVNLCLIVGLWLQLGYVIGVGGDFMRGRFLDSTLVGVAAFGGHWLARRPARTDAERHRALAPAALCGAVLAAGAGSLVDWRPRIATPQAIEAAGGIADEYSVYAGPRNENRFRPPTQADGSFASARVLGEIFARYSRTHGPITVLFSNMGIAPYYAGGQVHAIDEYGLTDAFVARCPADPQSRIGHINHRVPVEYLLARGTLNAQEDWQRRASQLDPTLVVQSRAMMQRVRWRDPAARERYQRIQRMIAGPIWQWDRLRDIPAYALGRL